MTAGPRTVLGVDIGQARDPTAVVVAEVLPGDRYRVRHLERLPLGTAYPEVSRRLETICEGVTRRAGHRPQVYMDATGVGKPVVDQFRASSRSARAIWAVHFTYGDARNLDPRRHRITLGKAHLVRRLQQLLRSGRVHLPAGHPEAEALVGELLSYELRVSESARETYGAFRVGTHDDLVTALGLAVQEEGSGVRGRGAGRPRGR